MTTPDEHRGWIDDQHLILLLTFGLRFDSNCLDVGAHTGMFLREFRRIAPSGRHIAYEPLPILFKALERQFPEMDIRQRALSNQNGESTFVHVQDRQLEGYSGLQERPYPGEVKTDKISISTERLDDHLPDGWLPNFVKIDVEGAETLVIEGAMRTLRRAKPVIAFEHGPGGSDQFGASDDDTYNLLCVDIGLRLFDMDGNGPLDLAQFKDELASGDRWNWIAHE